MVKTYIIGHKNPDADSICSAIAYADLKKKLGFKNIIPARAGKLNEQTKFILNCFKQKKPIFLEDLRIKAEDIMIKKVISIKENETIKKAVNLMRKYKVRFLPVIKDNNPVGVFDSLGFTEYFMKDIINANKNKIIKKLNMPVSKISSKKLDVCKKNEINNNIKKKLSKSRNKGLIVVNNNNNILGLITKTNILNFKKKQVIMVDHNEFSQSVRGIEETDIIEVIDHHRLSTFYTLYPMTFINEAIGSTCTIIAELYKTKNIKLSKKIAGVLIGGILSDTLCLTSTTTTQRDKEIVKLLSKTCKKSVNFFKKEFEIIHSKELEKVKEKAIKDIIDDDFKIYEHKDKKIGVGSVETLEFDSFIKKKNEFLKEIKQMKEKEKYDFLGLVIIHTKKLDSIMFCDGEKELIDKLPWKKIEADIYELKGVFSRKKQITPILLDLVGEE